MDWNNKPYEDRIKTLLDSSGTNALPLVEGGYIFKSYEVPEGYFNALEMNKRVNFLEIEVKALREIVQDQIEIMKQLIDNKVPLYSGSRWIDKDLTNEGLGRDMPSMVGDKKDLKPEWTKGNSWGDWAERFKKNKDE